MTKFWLSDKNSKLVENIHLLKLSVKTTTQLFIFIIT